MNDRFWLRPKWVFGHLLCLFLIVLFVNLGFWQLRRLHERRTHNRLIHEHVGAPVTSLDDALVGGATNAQFRRVRVTGTYDDAETVLVRSKSLDSLPGDDVLTPLVLDDGTAVIVNRGFAPSGGGGTDAMRQAVRAPGGAVTVSGYLRASESRGAFGPTDPPTGHLTVINRVDVPRLQKQYPRRLAPVYLQRSGSTPAEQSFLKPIPLPETSDGPHLSYAIQWFIFATIGAIGWPVLLYRKSREPDEAAEVDAEV